MKSKIFCGILLVWIGAGVVLVPQLLAQCSASKTIRCGGEGPIIGLTVSVEADADCHCDYVSYSDVVGVVCGGTNFDDHGRPTYFVNQYSIDCASQFQRIY